MFVSVEKFDSKAVRSIKYFFVIFWINFLQPSLDFPSTSDFAPFRLKFEWIKSEWRNLLKWFLISRPKKPWTIVTKSNASTQIIVMVFSMNDLYEWIKHSLAVQAATSSRSQQSVSCFQMFFLNQFKLLIQFLFFCCQFIPIYEYNIRFSGQWPRFNLLYKWPGLHNRDWPGLTCYFLN